MHALILAILLTSGVQLSADGRSVVGHKTWGDTLIYWLQPDKLLIGYDSDELAALGAIYYPELHAEGHNRAGHAIGAQILTQRYGFWVAQALGVLNEVYEAWVLAPYVDAPYFSEPRFDLMDVWANLQGSLTYYIAEPNSPWGLYRWLATGNRNPDPVVVRRNCCATGLLPPKACE